MAGIPLGAPSPTSSQTPLGATHLRVTEAGATLFYRQGDDPRDQAQVWARDRWATAATQNHALGAKPFAPVDTEQPVCVVSRTRVFGALVAGGGIFTVAASRRARECTGVHVVAGAADGADVLRGLLQPHEARILARALIEAAAAVDQAQRNPQFTRAEVRHG
jgi:hypothetical protein